MNRGSRENLAVLLTLLVLSWPASWLFFGMGPTVGPFWRLLAFYWSVSVIIVLAFAFVYAVIDTLLEHFLAGSER